MGQGCRRLRHGSATGACPGWCALVQGIRPEACPCRIPGHAGGDLSVKNDGAYRECVSGERLAHELQNKRKPHQPD